LVEQRQLKEVLGATPGVEAIFVPEYAPDAVSADGRPASATLGGLVRALAAPAPNDIVHFAGHARFRPESGPFQPLSGVGEIVLADEQGRAIALPAAGLVELIRGKGTRLVVLGACESGRRDGRNAWSSVAAALVKAGTPAVIAMQYTVNDRLAAAFSGALYAALVAGLPIEEAVTIGRQAMRTSAREQNRTDIRDWGVPILYLRASGGPIFNPVSDDAVRHEAEQRARAVVKQEAITVESTGRMIGPVVGDFVEGALTVQQKVDENVDGLMLAGALVSIRGGQITFEQRAGVVRGTLMGPRFGTFGGGQLTPAQTESALQELERRLGIERYDAGSPDTHCRSCGADIVADAQFCSKCGTKLR